jgi:hypothetical protein
MYSFLNAPQIYWGILPGSTKKGFFMREYHAVWISSFPPVSIGKHLHLLWWVSWLNSCGTCLHSFKLQLQRVASCVPPVVFFPQMAPSLPQVCSKSILILHRVGLESKFQLQLCGAGHTQEFLIFCNECSDQSGKLNNLGMYRGLTVVQHLVQRYMGQQLFRLFLSFWHHDNSLFHL